VPLVPSFRQCTSPNRQHGAPLAFGSCAAPHLASGVLTVGTSDSNGQTTNSVGSVRLDVIAGDPATPANEADVQVSTSLSDVRKQTDLSDYTGQLRVEPFVQITDRSNGPGQNEPATVEANPFPFTVPCAATGDPAIGGACTLSSSFNAILPGSVIEGRRAIWELNEVDVYDGGPDGQASTAFDNTLFARQGVFVP
jgi:hypothetical protein